MRPGNLRIGDTHRAIGRQLRARAHVDRAIHVGLAALLLMTSVGCDTAEMVDNDSDPPRLSRHIIVTPHHATPAFPVEGTFGSGAHVTTITPDRAGARLEVTADRWGEGVHLVLDATRRPMAAPLDARYLDTDDFQDIEATLTLGSRAFTGAVDRFEVELDLSTGIVYGSLVAAFEPLDGMSDVMRVGLDLAGYIEPWCVVEDTDGGEIARSSNLPEYSDADTPPACAAIFDAIQGTADDPDARPPPYALHPGDDGAGAPALTPAE